MMLQSTSSTATSIDATRRNLIVGIVIATLMALAIVIADLAIGGRPDPPMLRAAATLLDGAGRFRTGDDPHWADVSTDDNGWETVDMTALPGSHDGDVAEHLLPADLVVEQARGEGKAGARRRQCLEAESREHPRGSRVPGIRDDEGLRPRM
jgi:hypothetical protein